MELKGALQARLHGLVSADPKTPPPPPRIGAVVDSIAQVLELADRPMRARDIHAAAQELLGEPIKWSSVKATLGAHASTPLGRFERISHGRYRLASANDPGTG